MTEVEFMNLNAQILEAAGSVTATTLTLIFGYLAGLYFFLGRAARFIRLMGFVFFTIALAWMWGGQLGLITLIASTMGRADLAISEGTTYVFLTNEQLGFWTSWIELATVGLNGITIFVWVTFFYATFFYNWDRHTGPPFSA